MATSKKSTTKKRKSTTPAAPAKPSYEEVVAARRSMDQAHEEVASAERRLRSAKTIMSDFKIRDERVAEARKDLEAARKVAVAASAKFQELKYGSK